MNFLVGFTSSFCLSFMMKGKAPFSWQSSYSVIIATAVTSPMSEWIVPWAVCHVCCTLILSDCPCLSDHLYGPVRRLAGWRFHEVRPSAKPRSVVPHACSLLTVAPPLRPFLAYIVSFPCAACCHHCFLLFTVVSLRRWRASVFPVLTFRCLSIFSIEFPGCIILLFIEERQSIPLHWTFQTNHVITWFLLGIYWKLVSHCWHLWRGKNSKFWSCLNEYYLWRSQLLDTVHDCLAL
jgi:hypothetical protein